MHKHTCIHTRALQANRQAQLEHLVGAKRLEDRVAGILARVERELDVAGECPLDSQRRTRLLRGLLVVWHVECGGAAWLK